MFVLQSPPKITITPISKMSVCIEVGQEGVNGVTHPNDSIDLFF